MRKTLIDANGRMYVEDENGLWRQMSFVPAAGGMWVGFGEAQSLDEILGMASGNFVEMLSATISAAMDRSSPQADDSIPVDELTITDAKGARLLKRLQEGEEGEAP